MTHLSQRLVQRELTFIGELYARGENLYSFLKERSSGENLMLAVFDVKMEGPYRERYEPLEKIFPPPNDHKVRLAEGRLIRSRSALEEFYQEAVARGFEGIVGRSPSSRYEQAALRKKRKRTADVVILGIVKESTFFQGEDMVGSVLVGCAEKGDYLPVSRVASGFKDQERKALYEALMPFKTGEDEDFIYVKPALVIEVSFQETVESDRYDVGFTLRAPVFRRFRVDKKPNQEDIGLKNQFPKASTS